MKSLRLKQTVTLIISGAFASYAVAHAVFLLSWVCYLPLFLLLNGKTIRQSFSSGIIFGFGFSIVSFFWMLGAAKEFSGNQFAYGFLATTFSIVLFCIYWSGLLAFTAWNIKKLPANNVVKAAIAASCFVLAESLLTSLFSQMPYYLFNSGYGLLDNIFTIQWTAFFGFPFLNFLVVLVNYLVAQLIIEKRWRQLALPLTVVIFILTGGFLIKISVGRSIVPLVPVSIAIAAENIPPQLRWDAQGGNILAQRLLALNKAAALAKPNMVLWSESTIPWSYRPEDDLLQEILKEPYAAEAVHIIGFTGDYSKQLVYNSIYGINTDGGVLGRYDKTFLLDFIEKPVFGLNMPFLDLNGQLIEKGQLIKPINTPYGSAGIAICNEIVKPEAALRMVENGAEFLLNSSNDGWFKDSFIIRLHFLYARMSAVITRKDIVMNSNNGISGYVNASGEVLLKRKSKDFFLETVVISPNRYDNSSVYSPNLILILCSVMILSAFVIKIRFHQLKA